MTKLIKRFCITLLVIIVLFALFISIPQAIFAYQLIGKKMIGGIRNRYFYFDSSVTGYWSTPYYNAVNSWYNTNTYYAFAETSNINSSQVDMYTYEANDNNNGYTTFWKTTGSQLYAGEDDWKFCQVFLNKTNLSGTTTAYDSGVVAHELGHTCGLHENNSNVNTIMCQAAYGRAVTTPQTDDCNGINYLYPTGYYNP